MSSAAGKRKRKMSKRAREQDPKSLKLRRKRCRVTKPAPPAPPSSTHSNRRPRFSFVHRFVEDHKKPIYSVVFNHVDPQHRNMFVTVGANRVSVYRAGAGTKTELVQVFELDDPNECLYTATWSVSASGSPLVLVAGTTAVITIVNCETRQVDGILIGHGNAVNELRTHPRKRHWVLSASKDESVRLWSVLSQRCLAVFAGDRGHREEVLSCDFHLNDGRVLTGGMDHTVKVWDPSPHHPALEKAEAEPRLQSVRPLFLQCPVFSADSLHQGYVDTVRWYGDLVLSRAVPVAESTPVIVLWKLPADARQGQTCTKLCVFSFNHCNIWFVRFSLDFFCNLMVVGNKEGSVFVWKLKSKRQHAVVLQQCSTTVRQIAPNFDGSVLVAVCDDATVVRWNAQRTERTVHKRKRKRKRTRNVPH